MLPLGTLLTLIETAQQRACRLVDVPPERHDDMTVAWHPALLSARTQSCVVDCILDALYATAAPKLAPAHVTVACPAFNDGWGDTMLAWRTCGVLRAGCPKLRLTLMTQHAERAEATRGALTDIALASLEAPPPHTDLLLVAPTSGTTPAAGSPLLPWLLHMAQEVPTLGITEYSSAVPATAPWDVVTCGLGPYAQGIFIDHHLAARAAAYRSTDAATQAATRLAWARVAAASLIPAFAVAHCPALHVVYVSEAATVPLALHRALTMHGRQDKSLIIAVINHAITAADLQGHGSADLLPLQAGGGRAPLEHPVAQVWTVPRLKPQHFIEALMVADFAVVTGDQSLSDAISVGLPFAYEVRAHKATFANRLWEHASRFGAQTHAVMTPLSQVMPPLEHDWLPSWQRMCEDLRQHHDVTQSLLGRVVRTLRRSPVRDAHEAAIAQACAQINTPGGKARLAKCAQDLLDALVHVL